MSTQTAGTVSDLDSAMYSDQCHSLISYVKVSLSVEYDMRLNPASVDLSNWHWQVIRARARPARVRRHVSSIIVRSIM